MNHKKELATNQPHIFTLTQSYTEHSFGEDIRRRTLFVIIAISPIDAIRQAQYWGNCGHRQEGRSVNRRYDGSYTCARVTYTFVATPAKILAKDVTGWGHPLSIENLDYSQEWEIDSE